MRTIISILLLSILSTTAIGQKKTFKENTLKEISCLIENPYEFLDKQDTAILKAGRPASIQGGDKWEVALIDTSDINDRSISKIIIIGTGCGALTLYVSRLGNVVIMISYIPHKKAKLEENDLLETVKKKYDLDESGDAFIKTSTNKIGLSVRRGALIMAQLY